MDKYIKVVVWGNEEQLQNADNALDAAGAYSRRLVHADEGGGGWAIYFVAQAFLPRFTKIIGACGCGMGRRNQSIDIGKGVVTVRNPSFGLWSKDDDPPPFRGPMKGGVSSPVEEEVMSGVKESQEVLRLRAKIRRLVAMGEELSWSKVIDTIARDNYLASRVTTKTVRQVLREFL